MESHAAPAPAGMARRRSDVVGPGQSFGSVTDKITSAVLVPGFRPGWLVGFVIAFGVMSMFLFAITWLVIKGTGIWGVNIRSAGDSRSSTSSGGLVSVTRERSSPRSCCCSGRSGACPSAASPRR
jgi:hypothetical protein